MYFLGLWLVVSGHVRQRINAIYIGWCEKWKWLTSVSCTDCIVLYVMVWPVKWLICISTFKPCVNSDTFHVVKRRSQSVNFTRSSRSAIYQLLGTRSAEYDLQSDHISRMIFKVFMFSDSTMQHCLHTRADKTYFTRSARSAVYQPLGSQISRMWSALNWIRSADQSVTIIYWFVTGFRQYNWVIERG